MADAHNQLQEAAAALDGRLATTQGKPKNNSAKGLLEDMTAVPDMRDIAASRDAANGTEGDNE